MSGPPLKADTRDTVLKEEGLNIQTPPNLTFDPEIDSQGRLILQQCLFEFWLNVVHIPCVPLQVSGAIELPLTDIALQLWSSMAGSHVVGYVGAPAEPEDFYISILYRFLRNLPTLAGKNFAREAAIAMDKVNVLL